MEYVYSLHDEDFLRLFARECVANATKPEQGFEWTIAYLELAAAAYRLSNLASRESIQFEALGDRQ